MSEIYSTFILSLIVPLFLAPAAAIVALAGWMIANARRVRADSRIVCRLILLTTHSGRLIHELQKERGLSAARAAKGRKSPDDGVDAQRRETDAALEQFLSGLTEARSDPARHGRLADGLRHCEDELAQLSGLRHAIDLGDKDAPGVVAAYTVQIALLLDIVKAMVRLSARGRVTSLGLAYVNLLFGKELAGQERARINAALNQGAPTDADRNRMRDLSGAQDIYFNLFSSLAGTEMGAALTQILSGQAGADVVRMRARIDKSDVSGLTAAAWFRAATARIDGLKVVEDQAARQLLAAGTRALSTSQACLRSSVAMIGAAAGVAILAGALSGQIG